MGRFGGKLQKSKKSNTPSRKANALGYAKRNAAKSKSKGPSLSDVYEYQSEETRRGKVKLTYEREELIGIKGGLSGSEDEGEDIVGGRKSTRKPRLIGGSDDEGGIISDEDEDIDSDAAFDESDEERYAGFSFSHKKSKPKSKSKPKKKDSGRNVHFAVDLNEDEDEEKADSEKVTSDEEDEEDEEEEEEEEGETSEFIDVLDILDGRGDPMSEDDHNPGEVEVAKTKPTVFGSDEEENEDEGGQDSGEDSVVNDEDEDEEENSEQEEEDSDLDEEVDEDPNALTDLASFISGLDAGQKRKAPDDDETVEAEGKEERRQKRRILKEKTEAGVENEFATSSGATKLNLDDLLAPLASSSSSNLQSLKKSAKILASTSSKNQTLSAPLPQRAQERLDREAAYEQTKEEVDKWSATMRHIKEAEHLSFPLQAKPAGRTSNLELAAKFKPTTELESAVDKLLKSAKMREQDLSQTESLKMNHLAVEEVAARRAELAKMRELMFRAEAKAKRIAKIKSKTYRRIKKKEKAKMAALLGDDEDEDDEMDDEKKLKREVERARERATLKHKNTGKWAKAMKNRNELDEDQRKEINEMLDRGEKLRRKIRGEGSDSESEDEDSDEEEGEDGIARIKAKAFEELISLQKDDDDMSGAEGLKKGKSVFEMKFMKDARERDQHQVNRMMDDFVKEMGMKMPGDEDEDDPDVTGHEDAHGASVERIGGRVTYRPSELAGHLRPAASLASDTSSVTLKSTDLLSADGAHPTSPTFSAAFSPVSERLASLPTLEEPQNPWLIPAEAGASKTVQKKHEVAISKESSTAEKSKNKLKKRTKKRGEEKEKAKEESMVDISMSNVMTLGINVSAGPSSSKVTGVRGDTGKVKSVKSHLENEDEDSDANSEVEVQERALDRKGKGKAKGLKAFEQRDLVAKAFAGDNVVQEFEEAKRHEMQQDAPKEVDTTLPGWGSWGGVGTKKAPPKPYLIKKIAGIDPKSRADYGKAHVIINEKRDKKAAKYLVKDLPFPYTSKAQFERSMETPLGTEWNTRLGFQRGTLPKVVTKMGTVISPLEKHS
ncbi:Utp14 protein-domain-containing protein [Abortiporus biennis]|nr:Utp14 protein-domain-containing protein [Abortiporus biennis]